jgi:uroporphyrin-III C-methyltransferase
MGVKGTVYLVGAGPGAPDLLTLRAADLLRRADIVFHDALVHADTLAFAEKAEKVAVGKRCGRHSTAQRFINKRLIEAAHKYEVVVRLKGGDPMLFGRAQEEVDALAAANVAFAVVPGITAALAASAELGISLTQRGIARSVVLATPRVGVDEQPGDWAAGIHAGNTVVIYMGAGKAAEIAEKLLAQGIARATPVIVVENATLPERRETWCTVGTLEVAARQSVEGPALIIIGRVLDKAHQNVVHAEVPDEQADNFTEHAHSFRRRQ